MGTAAGTAMGTAARTASPRGAVSPPAGLGKPQEQRWVPGLPPKPLSVTAASTQPRCAPCPLLGQAPRWHRPQALRSSCSPANRRSCRWCPAGYPDPSPQPPGTRWHRERRCQRVWETSLRGRGFGAVDL